MADVAPPPVDDIKQPTETFQQYPNATQSEPLDLSAKAKSQKHFATKNKIRVSETTSTVYGFIRVKRRADEDPASKILVSFKRQRLVETQDEQKETTTEDYEQVENVLSFAGSVESHDHETINSFLEQFDANNVKAQPKSTKFRKNVKELRQLFTPASKLLHQQRRQEIQSQSKISRCKIVSAHRGLDPEALIGSSGPKPLAKYSMYDLIHHAEESEEITRVLPKSDEVITVNGVPMVPIGGDTPAAEPKLSAEGKGGGVTTYVYDLYALPAPIETEDAVNVERSWDDKELYFGDEEDKDEDHPYEDEEDSNAEDNPNNDYPEDEPEDDDEERDIEEADQDDAAGYDDEDASDDDGNVAGWVNGSKGMKELAKHMNTLKLGHTGMDAIYYNDDDEPEDDFDADALKEVDGDDDYEEEDYDY